jgi:hypothetical protein
MNAVKGSLLANADCDRAAETVALRRARYRDLAGWVTSSGKRTLQRTISSAQVLSPTA